MAGARVLWTNSTVLSERGDLREQLVCAINADDDAPIPALQRHELALLIGWREVLGEWIPVERRFDWCLIKA